MKHGGTMNCRICDRRIEDRFFEILLNIAEIAEFLGYRPQQNYGLTEYVYNLFQQTQ